MDKYKEFLQKVLETVELETNEMKQLEGEKLQRLRFLINQPTFMNDLCYFNMCTIVLTHPDDAASIRIYEGIEPLFKIEVPEYNYFIYGFRFLNNKAIADALLEEGTAGMPTMEATE